MSKKQKCFDVKVIGYEEIVADNEEEALTKFGQMMDKGYKVIDLRWKTVEVDALEEME